MSNEIRLWLKRLIRTLYDYQDMRIRTAGRLRLKADGTGQNLENQNEVFISHPFYQMISDIWENSVKIEKEISKNIKKFIENLSMWDIFFKNIKGCGHMTAAICLSEFDIIKAETVSKMWQFSGLNPGMVLGKKRKQKKDGSFTIKISDELVRGDRIKAGFISPYNIWLRTKLCGVIASNFIKAQNEYALKYYYPYKERLENEERWKDKTRAHRDKAAKRYMIKMFLKDLYMIWRTLEGLPVRKPYQEEYLGHIHNKPDENNKPAVKSEPN